MLTLLLLVVLAPTLTFNLAIGFALALALGGICIWVPAESVGYWMPLGLLALLVGRIIFLIVDEFR